MVLSSTSGNAMVITRTTAKSIFLPGMRSDPTVLARLTLRFSRGAIAPQGLSQNDTRAVGCKRVLAGSPVSRRELLKPFKISTVGITRRLGTFLHQFIQIGGQDGPNCVKRIVAP
jgi:hypothetical protein